MNSTDPSQKRPVSAGEWVVRAIAVVVLVPVRLLWEAVKACILAIVAAGNFVLDKLLVPVFRFLWYRIVWPVWRFVKDVVLKRFLWGMVLVPLGRFLRRWVLRPLAYVFGELLWKWVVRPVLYALFTAVEWLWRRVLRPAWSAVAAAGRWLWRWCVELPLQLLWRWILLPAGSFLGAVLAYGWRGATAVARVVIVVPCLFVYRFVLRPVLRAVGKVWEVLVLRPLRWVRRSVLAPVNRIVTDLVKTVFGR